LWVKTALDWMFAPRKMYRETKAGRMGLMNNQLKKAHTDLAKIEAHVDYLNTPKGKEAWEKAYAESQKIQKMRSTKKSNDPVSIKLLEKEARNNRNEEEATNTRRAA